MEHETIYISKANYKQIKWWNEVATKYVKFNYLDSVVDENTKETIGYVFEIKGLFAKLVAKKNNTFLKDTEPVVFIIKD